MTTAMMGGMRWERVWGGLVLSLKDGEGRILATIDGPHPAGYALTMHVPARRPTRMLNTLDNAQQLGEALTQAETGRVG